MVLTIVATGIISVMVILFEIINVRRCMSSSETSRRWRGA